MIGDEEGENVFPAQGQQKVSNDMQVKTRKVRKRPSVRPAAGHASA